MSLDMSERMFFVIGAPRSGTTMLMRMLNVHPDIYTRPEPHLLTPLAHLGYYAYVDKAPYDPYQAHEAAREFVEALEYYPGMPQRPFTVEQLREKFNILTAALPQERRQRFFEQFLALETAANVADLETV